ncbi:MAG: hypothetical protein ACFFD4_07030, partial [Candidatus Odinarchaeota archaeon]
TVKNQRALAFGISLLEETLFQTICFFGPNIDYYSAICPVWFYRTRESRFTGKQRVTYERPLLRIQLKVKPLYTNNRVKVFVQLREQLRNPKVEPVDYDLLPVTTCKMKLLLIEKLKTGKIETQPPMGQYLLAKAIKTQLDPVSSIHPLQLRVHVDQREKKERLIINGELIEINVERLKSTLKDLLKRLGTYFTNPSGKG